MQDLSDLFTAWLKAESEPSLMERALFMIRRVTDPMGAEIEVMGDRLGHADPYGHDTLNIRARWGNIATVGQITRQSIVNAGDAAVEIAASFLEQFQNSMLSYLRLAHRGGKTLTNVPILEPEPVLDEFLIGYRVWRVDRDGGLIPLGLWSGSNWQGNREVEAECKYGRHTAPGPDPCHCGWNLYATPEIALSREASGVLGVVAAHGDIYTHVDGFRAQFARPLALVDLPDRATGKPQGLPLLASIEELVEFGAQYGQTMTDDIAPGPEHFRQVIEPSSYGLWQVAPAQTWRELGEAQRRYGVSVKDVALAFKSFNTAFEPGQNLHLLHSAYRSLADQRALYDQYASQRPFDPWHGSPPGMVSL